LVALLHGTGCSTFAPARIPGLDNEPYKLVEMERVPRVSEVTAAVRREIQAAYARVPQIRAKYMVEKGGPACGLTPKQAAIVFSGKTQLVQSESANVAAVFPFTGYAGSTLTPNIGISSSATSTQETTLSFSLMPKLRVGNETVGGTDWLYLDVEGETTETVLPVDAGFVTRMLDATFDQIASGYADVPPSDGVAMTRSDREIKLTTTFQVALSADAGVGFELKPSTPDINSVKSAPLLGSSHKPTGTYTLSVTIPLVTPQTQDPKRILGGVSLASGSALFLDQPFTQELWTSHVARLVSGEATDVSEFNKAKKEWEQAEKDPNLSEDDRKEANVKWTEAQSTWKKAAAAWKLEQRALIAARSDCYREKPPTVDELAKLMLREKPLWALGAPTGNNLLAWDGVGTTPRTESDDDDSSAVDRKASKPQERIPDPFGHEEEFSY
jgi:hypothetical protein